MSDSSEPMEYSPPDSSVHGDFPGKNTRVDCHFLFQGIFPTQGWNLSLLHWQGSSLPLGDQGRPFLYSTWSLLSFRDELFILNNLRTCLSYFLNIFSSFPFFLSSFYLFIYLGCTWSSCCVQALCSCCEWGSPLLQWVDFLLQQLLLLQSTVAAQGPQSTRASVVAAHRLCRSAASGIFLDQGSNCVSCIGR